jgi:hypothetical protein
VLANERHDAGHLDHRHALGDADDDLDAGVNSLEDGSRRTHRRYVDDRCVGAGLGDRLGHGVEDRDRALEGLSTLPRRDPGHHLGAVFDHLLRVE